MSEAEDIAADQYRFNGYQLPMIQLDETGPAYINLPFPHPYYYNQPMDWQKPCYLDGAIMVNSAITVNSPNIPDIPMLPL